MWRSIFCRFRPRLIPGHLDTEFWYNNIGESSYIMCTIFLVDFAESLDVEIRSDIPLLKWNRFGMYIKAFRKKN